MDPKLAQFDKQNFLNLETFRKSGVGVPTPVWFVLESDILYVRTLGNSGKVKRVLNNGKARVAPCDARGNLLGEWVEATASLVTDPKESEHANQLLSRKYGLQKTSFDMLNWFRKAQWVTLMMKMVS